MVNDLPKRFTQHDPAYTVNFGAEYVFVDQTRPKQKYLPSLRAGIFYDPEPASGRKDRWWGVDNGNGEPDDFYGVTLGGGLLIGSRVNIDAAYQFRWGNDVRRDTLAGGTASKFWEQDFGTDVQQHSFYLSTVIYF